MRLAFGLYLFVIALILLGIAYIQLDLAASMNNASVAIQSASHSFVDRQQAMDGQEQRIGLALGQLEKDMIRLRTYLKKKGG